MSDTPETLTKAAFAAHINVHPSRLSHYIRDGVLGPEALEGEGRNARIRVAVAVEQIRARRDVGQSLGNGITVRLSPAAVGAPPAPGPAAGTASASVAAPPRPDPPSWSPRPDSIEERIKQEKLDQIARQNRREAEDEARRAGRYIDAADARREMGLIAEGMLQVLEQSLATFATAVAARFQVPQRDALHLLKTEFRGVRLRAAETLSRQAAALPRLVEDAGGPLAPGPADDDAAREPGAPEA